MLIGIDGRFANLPRRAGVGAFSHAMLAALPSVLDGCSLRVYLDRPPRPDFPLPPDDPALRVLPAARFWTQRVLAAELAAQPPAAYVSPLFQLPWRCPCPAVPVAHDFAFLRFPGEFTVRRRLQARAQAWHAVRLATRIVAVSEATAADLQHFHGVDPARVQVCLEAAAPVYRPQPEARVAALRQRLGLPPRFVLYLGRLQPRKNLVRLIDAFGRVVARRPDLPHHLILGGGRGWLYETIYQAAQDSPARDRIRFLDFVPEEDLPALYAAAEAMALVSLWEGFGLPVLEAMACGTPVLTSSVSSLPEIAGDAAQLVDPADTVAIASGLEALMGDAERRARLREAGLARAAAFSWTRSAAVLVDAARRAARA
jgi:glycosyltransferase involved in cell wall biosynthesis